MKYIFSIVFWLFLINCSRINAENTLNRGNGSEPDSLNIHLAEGLNSHNILRDLYEGLMTVDVNGKPIYGAAISHQLKGNIWTFKLRANAQWSDGSPVVAADFVRAWRRAVDPDTAAPYAFLLNNILHAKKIMQMKLSPDNLVVIALDDYTLEIRLWQADSSFLEKLSLPIFYPMPKTVASTTNNNRQIISNGAYKLTGWNIQEKIVLQKNPHYYAKENIYFDKINYWVTENQSSELKRSRAGELDITESIPDSQIAWIKLHLPTQLHIAPYLGSFFLGLNLSDQYLKNLKLRQALSLAIDRTILTEKVLKTGQQPAFHIVPRELVNNITTRTRDKPSNRIQQAQRLLKQSGINIQGLKIEILYNNSENQRKVAIAIAAMWRQTLGIRSRLVNQEWKVFVQSRKSGKRQAFRSGWIADYADALSFLELFTTHSRFNFYHYKNSEYDKIIERISKTADDMLKKQLIERAEIFLLHDIPVIPLYYYVSRHLVNDQLLGFEDNIADRHLSKYIYSKEN